MRERKQGSSCAVLCILAGTLLLALVAFMTIGVEGRWGYVLPLRAQKLAGLLLVAYAIAASTVLFQTITENRILTPSIMGFDALYVVGQTVLAATFGFMKVNALDPRVLFFMQAAVMLGAASLLYRWLFDDGQRDLMFLALAGLILGGLLRSLANFMQRVIDPGEFAVLQDRMFASFNLVDSQLLVAAAVLVGIVSVAGWRIRHCFDVLALGREVAINLGVDYARMVRRILLLIAVLVSVSTALVGPVTFFGLLVTSLAYRLIQNSRHAVIIPAATLIAMLCLVGGQFVLERLFGLNTSLSIVVEFLGGVTFILLITRKSR